MTAQGVTQMLVLFEAAYGVTYSPIQVSLWEQVMVPWSDEDGRRAALVHIRSSKFAPKPAEIIAVLQPAVAVEEADADALQAWRLCREGPIADPYKTFLMQDKVAALALDAVGGARLLSQMPEDELERFTRPQFCRAYRSFAVAQRAHPTGKMVGILEQENAARFLLGDEDLRRLTAPTRTLPPTEPPAPPRPLPPPERPDVPPGKGIGPLKSALDALKFLRDRGKKPQTEGEGA